MSHPDVERLRDFVLGVEHDDDDALRAHVRVCTLCAGALAREAALDDELSAIRAQADASGALDDLAPPMLSLVDTARGAAPVGVLAGAPPERRAATRVRFTAVHYGVAAAAALVAAVATAGLIASRPRLVDHMPTSSVPAPPLLPLPPAPPIPPVPPIAPVPPVPTAPAVDDDAAAIAPLRAQQAALKRCFVDVARLGSQTITLDLEVDVHGRVDDVAVTGSAAAAGLQPCVHRVLRDVEFPARAHGYHISVPFKIRAP